jgi:peptidoglycan/LPS O-acetylase OafA/YrhL
MYLFGFLAGFGHPAVVIFFVLSGFLVGGRLLEQVRSGADVDLRRYVADRFVRIYLVLLPVLAVVFLLDTNGSRLFHSNGAYEGYALKDHFSLSALLGATVNLQNIFTPYWGTDGPLGTLANEFWYYLTFPLLLLPWVKGRVPGVKALGFATGAALLIVFSVRWPWHGIGFALWLLGVSASLSTRALVRNPMTSVCVLAFVLVTVRIGLRQSTLAIPFVSVTTDLATAALFAVSINSFRHYRHEAGEVLASTIHARLARFSYSLYAIHFPLLLFLCAGEQTVWGFGIAGTPTRFEHWALLAINPLIVLAFSDVFAWVTERNTGLVRKRLYRLLRIRPHTKIVSANAVVDLEQEKGRDPEVVLAE